MKLFHIALIALILLLFIACKPKAQDTSSTLPSDGMSTNPTQATNSNPTQGQDIVNVIQAPTSASSDQQAADELSAQLDNSGPDPTAQDIQDAMSS